MHLSVLDEIVGFKSNKNTIFYCYKVFSACISETVPRIFVYRVARRVLYRNLAHHTPTESLKVSSLKISAETDSRN
jgi:hypothetical protein